MTQGQLMQKRAREERKMAKWKEESGILYEIPLVFAGYGILGIILLPFLTSLFPGPAIPLALFLSLGLGLSYWVSLAISVPRWKPLRIPLSIWSYCLFSLLTFPLMLGIVNEIAASFILPLQAYISYRLDLHLSIYHHKNLDRNPLKE